MADKIVITQANVANVVSELRAEQTNIGNYKSNIETELDNINKAWEGADAIKYTQKMRDDYAVLLEAFNESLESYINFLDKVYGEYERFDNEYAGKSIEV